jgi:hypothetical protein
MKAGTIRLDGGFIPRNEANIHAITLHFVRRGVAHWS